MIVAFRATLLATVAVALACATSTTIPVAPSPAPESTPTTNSTPSPVTDPSPVPSDAPVALPGVRPSPEPILNPEATATPPLGGDLGLSPAPTPLPPAVLQLPDVASVVEDVRPTVVSVVAAVITRGFFGQLIEDFSSGTGVIFDPQGYILTNNHVVQGATEVEVTMDDGRQLSAEVVGTDALVDLAVLKIVSEEEFPAARLGSSSGVQVGEWVIAIGNALALPGGPTVTVGVISALGRIVDVGGGVTLYDLLQTDTAINPGNSGGPLVNLRGEVVGINTLVRRDSQTEGIGFAINMETAISVAQQLKDEGRVRWAYLGVGLGDLDPERAARAGVPVREGAVVTEVIPGGPASQGGLREGDIILAVDGEPVPTVQDLIRRLRQELIVGQRVEVRVFRDGGETELEVTLGERPS